MFIIVTGHIFIAYGLSPSINPEFIENVSSLNEIPTLLKNTSSNNFNLIRATEVYQQFGFTVAQHLYKHFSWQVVLCYITQLIKFSSNINLILNMSVLQ